MMHGNSNIKSSCHCCYHLRPTKMFLFSSKIEDRLWGPPSILFSENRCYSAGLKRPGREVDYSPLVSMLRISEVVPFLPLYAFTEWGDRDDLCHIPFRSIMWCLPDQEINLLILNTNFVYTRQPPYHVG
jgi:hypothetical protein